MYNCRLYVSELYVTIETMNNLRQLLIIINYSIHYHCPSYCNE